MIKFYQTHGKTTEKDSNQACGKAVYNENSGQWVYYIKFMDGGFIDPFSRDISLVGYSKFQWVRVKEETFQFYANFLSGGNKTNLSYAERSV